MFSFALINQILDKLIRGDIVPEEYAKDNNIDPSTTRKSPTTTPPKKTKHPTKVKENLGLIRQLLRQNYLPDIHRKEHDHAVSRITKKTSTKPLQREERMKKGGKLGYLNMMARALSPKLGIPLRHYQEAIKATIKTSEASTAEGKICSSYTFFYDLCG